MMHKCELDALNPLGSMLCPARALFRVWANDVSEQHVCSRHLPMAVRRVQKANQFRPVNVKYNAKGFRV